MSHGRLYQRRIKNAFDKKVRPRKFNEGDLVLKKMSHAVKDNRGKWAPNYEGPVVVKRAFSGGALILTHMDGEELPSPVNQGIRRCSLGQSRGSLQFLLILSFCSSWFPPGIPFLYICLVLLKKK